MRSATRASSSWLALLERFLRLPTFGNFRIESAPLAVQLDKDRDFRAEDIALDRLTQIVDGPDAVAAQDVLILDEMRRQEQDRHVLIALALFDEVRQLDAARAGHPDVENHRGEVVAQQREQRLVGRGRSHGRAAGRLQDDLQRVEVQRLVVDDKDPDVFGCHVSTA